MAPECAHAQRITYTHTSTPYIFTHPTQEHTNSSSPQQIMVLRTPHVSPHNSNVLHIILIKILS